MISPVRARIEAVKEEIRQVTGGGPVVVAFSGGLDSTTAAALARDALGASHVLLITVNMGEYAYRRGNQIVLEMAERLGLRQRCLLGQHAQHRVQRTGPACNRCTREIKLGMVRAAAKGRLVLTGANRSDTWGQMGVKVCDGYYAPLLDWDKAQIREVAASLGVIPPRVGESPGREGCKLKHLLKPLVAPGYHGRAVARANEVVLQVLGESGWQADLANVKIIGPLRANVGLVNIRPLPAREVRERVIAALAALPELEAVHLVEGPLRLVVKASPGIVRDAHARHWVHHGRLAPDFAFPIDVEWHESPNARLHTFHVVEFSPLDAEREARAVGAEPVDPDDARPLSAVLALRTAPPRPGRGEGSGDLPARTSRRAGGDARSLAGANAATISSPEACPPAGVPGFDGAQPERHPPEAPQSCAAELLSSPA